MSKRPKHPQVSLSGATYEKLKRESARRGCTITALLEKILTPSLPDPHVSKPQIVYSREECIFHFCPTPNICQRSDKCEHPFQDHAFDKDKNASE